MKTNFDVYLEEQMKDPAFAERFAKAGEAWDVALQIASLREKAGLSQRDLARNLRQISRLDAPSYEGHSLSMLRRVAEVLGATVRVTLAPKLIRNHGPLGDSIPVQDPQEILNQRFCGSFSPR